MRVFLLSSVVAFFLLTAATAGADVLGFGHEMKRPEWLDESRFVLPQLPEKEGFGELGVVEYIMHSEVRHLPLIQPEFDLVDFKFPVLDPPKPTFPIWDQSLISSGIEISYTMVGSTDDEIGMNFEQISSVPLPGAAVIFLLGLACLGLRRRF
jgi:hypothetical protein